jgi:large subunit ribosomal protein L10
MSKYVKDLITSDLRQRLDGVGDMLLVDVIGMENNQNVLLRQTLRQKQIQLLVVKNSLARRATEGTTLATAFEGAQGTMAVVWGGEDIVSLAKEVMRLADQPDFAPFAPKGGVMDGQRLSADEVKQVSKWPSREELLSLVAGQLVGPASELASQLVAPAQQIASQIDKLIEMKEQAGE